MTKRITDWPHKNMIKCAVCDHVCKRDSSEYPSENTPPEKIHIRLGTRLAAMFCSNPVCHCYTIYAPSSSIVDKLTEKYKSKNNKIGTATVN